MLSLTGINATRQNHALEHATIAVILERKGFKRRLAGRSNASGFHILGDLGLEEVEQASAEALERLQRGEADLAVSPFCGTNIAVAGMLAGLWAFAATRADKHPMQQIPNAMLAGILAVVVGQPLGTLAQKYMTTSPDLSRVRITGVSVRGWGPFTIHRVETVHQ